MGWLGIATLLLLGCAHTAPETRVPTIGQWMGVRVGETTMPELEAKWGPGKAITGGHPDGARLWRIAGTDWQLHADAFEYSQRGVVVDDVDLSVETAISSDVPVARIPAQESAWLGSISLGQSDAEVQHALQKAGFTAKPTQEGWVIEAVGFAPLVQDQAFTYWDAVLRFREGRLDQIALSARAAAPAPAP